MTLQPQVPLTVEPWWQAVLPYLVNDTAGTATFGWLRSLGVIDSNVSAVSCHEAMTYCLAIYQTEGRCDLSAVTLARYLSAVNSFCKLY